MWKRAAKIFTTDGNYTAQLESLASAGPKKKAWQEPAKRPLSLPFYTNHNLYVNNKALTRNT